MKDLKETNQAIKRDERHAANTLQRLETLRDELSKDHAIAIDNFLHGEEGIKGDKDALQKADARYRQKKSRIDPQMAKAIEFLAYAKHNRQVAQKTALIEATAETLTKYAGKPCGEKTRTAFCDEVKAKLLSVGFDCYVCLQRDYDNTITSVKCSEVGSYEWIECYTQHDNINGHRFAIVDKNNKFAAVSVCDFVAAGCLISDFQDLYEKQHALDKKIEKARADLVALVQERDKITVPTQKKAYRG